MRVAAGILLMIFGVRFLGAEALYLRTLIVRSKGTDFFPFSLLHIVFAVLIVAGGFLCIRRRYWGLCLASALLVVYIVISWLITRYGWLVSDLWPIPASPSELMGFMLFVLLGVLPIILVCTRRKEWKEVSGGLDREVSNDG